MADLVISNLASAERMVRVFSLTVTTTATMPLLVTILSPGAHGLQEGGVLLGLLLLGPDEGEVEDHDQQGQRHHVDPHRRRRLPRLRRRRQRQEGVRTK